MYKLGCLKLSVFFPISHWKFYCQLYWLGFNSILLLKKLFLISWPKHYDPWSYLIFVEQVYLVIQVVSTKFAIVITNLLCFICMFCTLASVTTSDFLTAFLIVVQYKFCSIFSSVQSSPGWSRYLWYHVTMYIWSLIWNDNFILTCYNIKISIPSPMKRTLFMCYTFNFSR